MITYPVKDLIRMQRDMDLTRHLLLQIESNASLDGTRWVHFEPSELGMADRTPEEIGYHLNLLIEEGYVKGQTGFETIPVISRLTWQGHELLDNIRDKGIWERAKGRLSGLPSISLKILADIATAEIKKHVGL
jgi:Hypothetical protein (DUF2513)